MGNSGVSCNLLQVKCPDSWHPDSWHREFDGYQAVPHGEGDGAVLLLGCRSLWGMEGVALWGKAQDRGEKCVCH